MSLTSAQSSFDNIHISIPIGIFIGLLASFVQSLGLTIQRKSHVINQGLPKHRQRLEHRRPLWLLGLAIFILSNVIGSLIQIASLPVVILAPLGAVSLLWNALFARLILGDLFSPWMILGTVLIAAGAVLIAIFGIVPEPTHSLEDLLLLFRRPAFVVYFSLLGIIVFFCLTATHFGEYSWLRKAFKPSPLPGAASYNTALNSVDPAVPMAGESIVTERTPLLDRKKDQSQSSSSTFNTEHSLLDTMDHTPILLAISYASISGILSGMCLIFAKSGVELLLLTIGGKNQFRRWESWILVAGLIAFALLQLLYLHKALVLANPTLVCPSAFCFYNLSSIVNGLVYFNQLQLIKAFHLCLVALGIVVLLGGVWVVSIQSGGGGVDVGIWNEEDQDVIDDASIGTVDIGHEDVSPFQCSDNTVEANVSYNPTLGPVPMERETRSEPYLSTLATSSSHVSSPELGTASGQNSPHTGNRHIPRVLLSPPPFHTRFSRRRMTMGSESQQSSTSTHRRNPSHASNSFSSPLNNTVSAFGTGLQIGLSPISPGFVIVPRERGRGLSGLGVSDMVQGSQAHVRRTVSEGGVRAHVLRDEPGCSTCNTEANMGAVSGPNVSEGQARKRWKWVREFYKRS